MPGRNRSRASQGRRGFAAMNPEERREISRRGGEASHQSGRGHEFTSEEAREAGRLGGEARWGRAASRTRTRGTSGTEEDVGVPGWESASAPGEENGNEDRRRKPRGRRTGGG